jgi:ABC-type transport system involved in cytochrome bd biosynthesis fused ATPase/permease subunit
MSATDMIVSARGVKRRYRMGDEEVWALAGVDLDIKRGEYLSIMGPSGLRQEHAVQHDRRAGSADRGPGHHGRPGHPRRWT